jgi:ABC-type cobalamin/Fe3+-siderophores transport system ATPase subunit
VSIALEVHELWKGYVVGVRGCSAIVSVLRGVNLQIASGERVGIAGSAGSGKTTLLHCIAGLRRADSGLVRLPDRAGETLVLLDEGMMERTPPHRPPAAATLIFARDPARIREHVDRLLVLRSGRLVPLDPFASARPAPRRVAERRAPPRRGLTLR